VNSAIQAKYFYLDLDAAGGQLNGANRYTVTFAKGQTPPVHGFWSLTLYNEYHFFSPNDLKRYSLGTKNKTLKYNADDSLTIYVQADALPDPEQRELAAGPQERRLFALPSRLLAEGRDERWLVHAAGRTTDELNWPMRC
jgi:hypothetical protein